MLREREREREIGIFISDYISRVYQGYMEGSLGLLGLLGDIPRVSATISSFVIGWNFKPSGLPHICSVSYVPMYIYDRKVIYLGCGPGS